MLSICQSKEESDTNFWQDFVPTQPVLNSDQFALKQVCSQSEQEEKLSLKKTSLKPSIKSSKDTRNSAQQESIWSTIDCLRFCTFRVLFFK